MLDRKSPGLPGRCVRTMLERWTAPCVLSVVAVFGVACGGSTPSEPTPVPAEDPTPTPIPADDPEPTSTPVAILEPTPTPADDPLPTPMPEAEAGEAETFRQMTFEYWEAFNAYDADRVLEFLEEAYGQEREEKIRSDTGRLKLFSGTAGRDRGEPSVDGGRGRVGDVPEDERSLWARAASRWPSGRWMGSGRLCSQRRRSRRDFPTPQEAMTAYDA